MQALDPGTAIIEPSYPVVAGAYTTIALTYTAGHPIDDSGYLKIAFRQMGDFGTPQFADPSAANYCSIQTTAHCRIEPRWDNKGHTRPWSRALFLKVTQGYVDRDDRITVTFGDRSGGSPGWRMQTFCEHTFEFKVLVDPIATYEFKELPTSPTIRVVAGPAVRALCIGPSHTLAGKPFTYHLKLEDRWGNPTACPQEIVHSGFSQAGIQAITAEDETTGLVATSNPIVVLASEPALRRYWADFHGQSEETVGTNSIEDYFAFARDMGLLDIAAHQGNDFQVSDDFWREINETTRRFNIPGKFVTFPGYEWSGNTPLGGDRNVYYSHEGGTIVHSCYDLLPGKTSTHPIALTAAELFEHLSKTVPASRPERETVKNSDPPQAFAWAHVGGRYADMVMHHPEVELAAEVHSSWGTFDWLVEDALVRGQRIGIVAGSDDHKGRPGAAYPGAGEFGSLGGLTCVLAERLDRPSVLDALRKRHTYATTGHRPWIDLQLVTPDGRQAMMGDIVESGGGTPEISLHVIGTAPIESVEVHNGLQLVRKLRLCTPGTLGTRVKVTWSGAEVKGRGRMSRWDGWLEVSGNAILSFQPINFWNADQPIEQLEPGRLQWRSVTTGGLAGVILTLREPYAGSLKVHTPHVQASCSLRKKLYTPREWECGGLRKRLSIFRLPSVSGSHEYSCTLPLPHLRPGDNPVFVRVTQEDGHVAWTSPVYVVRE